MKKKILFSEYVKNDIEKTKIVCKNVREYAEFIGISHTVVHDMLNGKYDAPSPLTAARMCDWFGLTPDELFEMIDNVDDEYINEFNKKYNDDMFENTCKKSIEYFFRHNNHSDMFPDGIITAEDCISFHDISLENLKIVNTDKSSIYDNSAYNATCEIYFYEQIPGGDSDSEGVYYDGSYYTDLTSTEDAAIYYLPPRRVRKTSNNIYADENFRDFTNKMFHLLTIKKPKYYNNFFLTTSRKLYDEILEYTKNLDIEANNGVGIGLIYCQYRKWQDSEVIIPNGTFVEGYIFGE